MKLIIEIDLDNEAFQVTPQRELARIFSDLVRRYPQLPRYNPGGFKNVLIDRNGNTVGHAEVAK